MKSLYYLGLGFFSIVVLQLGTASNAWAENNAISIKQKRVQDLKKDLKPIVYAPKTSKAFVYILTDFNCSYCSKLHAEIPTLLDLGIEVRVLAMPRQGVPSPSYTKWVSSWCSENSKEALTQAMKGEAIPLKQCKNPIQTQYKLGKAWGAVGTPTFLFADGTLKSGYYSAIKLAIEAVKHSQNPDKQ